MKGAIDMYRKISPDLVVATNRGGAFSIGAIVLMSYLAFVETWAFVGSGDVREKIDAALENATVLASLWRAGLLARHAAPTTAGSSKTWAK